MVINNTYVKESIIARMDYVKCAEDKKDYYANILTTYGSQIQVRCTEEEYKSLLIYLENKEGK